MKNILFLFSIVLIVDSKKPEISEVQKWNQQNAGLSQLMAENGTNLR